MLIKLIVVIILQSICISQHQLVDRKYVQFLFVNYVSVNPGEKGHKEEEH